MATLSSPRSAQDSGAGRPPMAPRMRLASLPSTADIFRESLAKSSESSCFVELDGNIWNITNLNLPGMGRPALQSARQELQLEREKARQRRRPEPSMYPSKESVSSIFDLSSEQVFNEIDRASTRKRSSTMSFAPDYTSPVVDVHTFRTDQETNGYFRRERVENSLCERVDWVPVPKEAMRKVKPSSHSKVSPDDPCYVQERRPPSSHCLKSPPPYGKTDFLQREGHEQQPIPSTPRRHIEIEVSPGVNLPLRGAAETRRAIIEERLNASTCQCCRTELFCIDTADFVICEVCKVVSPVSFRKTTPVEEYSYTVHNHISDLPFTKNETGGVGLGLSLSSLQAEMNSLRV